MNAGGTGATLDAVAAQLETILGVEFHTVAWAKWETKVFSGVRVHLTSDRPIQQVTPDDSIDIEVPGVLLADIRTIGTQQVELLLVNERG